MKRDARTCHVVTAEVAAGKADAVSALFPEPAAQFERPGHPRVWLEWYVDSRKRSADMKRKLDGLRAVAAATPRPFTKKDWLSIWKRQLRGGPVSPRLYLSPSWEKSPAAPGRLVLRIEPGLGFGTGNHFTTRFCLEKLDGLCQKFSPRSVLDVGTGSGIIAIAAAKLGCGRVTGYDNDPQAIDNARRNARLNRVGEHVKLRVRDALGDRSRDRFDVVCANLFAPLLVELAPRLARLARHRLILSGVREIEADMVSDAYAMHGAIEIARDGDGEWAGLLMRTGGTTWT